MTMTTMMAMTTFITEDTATSSMAYGCGIGGPAITAVIIIPITSDQFGCSPQLACFPCGRLWQALTAFDTPPPIIVIQPA
jgi:hypothetical protein